MNNYVKIFKLKTRTEINAFIFDFIEFKKVDRVMQQQIPHKPIDYVSTFKLKNDKLVNKFIDDFCNAKQIDECVKIAMRDAWENQVGIGMYREEDQYWRLKRQQMKLEKEWRHRHGKPN